MQNQHYQELKETHKQLHGIRHDMNNYLRTASALAKKQGNNENLISYLNQISCQIAEIEQVISTGNENMDSVLNIKLAEINRCHIPVTTEITVPADMSFSFRQAVTILGNLLDNAVEACLALAENERWLLIKISYINHALYIQIDNSCQNAVQWKNDVPLSTKADKYVHGLGIKNIKEIIGDEGTLSLKSNSNYFQAKVILYETAPANQF